MSALSDLINQSLERRGLAGLSLRELSERSDNKLSKDAVRLYRGGNHGRPTEEVLWAWSDLLLLPIEELRDAAGVPVGQHEPYVPPNESSRLSERQRAAVDELIRSIVGPVRESIFVEGSLGKSTEQVAGGQRAAARARQRSALSRAEAAGHPNADELAELDQLRRKADSE